jgi:vacuolar-type H+-ATPase subunit D/Vma8
MSAEQKTYTSEELRLALLEQKNDSFYHTLIDIKTEIRETRQDVKSHFHWMMGSISVLYISLIGTLVTALAKSLKWF